MGDSFCEHCGTRKKPLVYSMYCPNDCDREGPPRDPTRTYPTLECPWCGTSDTEPFPNCERGDWHCNPHGHVWWSDGQEA